MTDGHEGYAAIASLTWYAGLHSHECFRIDTAIAEQVLRENDITIKGKGGKIRTVPVNGGSCAEFKKLLTITLRSHKLFVPDEVPTDIAIQRLQQYIYNVKLQIQDEDSTCPMTYHGPTPQLRRLRQSILLTECAHFLQVHRRIECGNSRAINKKAG